jgi:hypothetical protein
MPGNFNRARKFFTCLETKSFSKGGNSVLFPRIDVDSSIALFPMVIYRLVDSFLHSYRFDNRLIDSSISIKKLWFDIILIIDKSILVL